MRKLTVKIIIAVTYIALLTIAGLLIFHSSYLGWNGTNGYRAWPCAMGYGSIGGIMMILWIVVIGALIYMIFKVVTEKKFLPANTMAKSDAMEILKQRYAKGEISKADFESMKQTLR